MNDYFSEETKDPSDWTGDCLSLDEEPLPTVEADQHQLTGVDLILLATIPRSAILLAGHLLHCRRSGMPRRVREEILEVTKTVTLMEIVKAGPGKHPRSFEVTVTNIASDTGHPVSLKIQHMHQSQNVDHTEAQTQTPEIIIKEQTTDALTQVPKGTTRVEQEHVTKVERLKPSQRSSRSMTKSSNATFNRQADNLIDLQFTQPVLSETSEQQQQQQRLATSQQATGNQDTTVGRTVHSLYYRPFMEQKSQRGIHFRNTAPPTATEAIHRTPLKERSSIVDEIDLTSMASEASSDGSVIIYADPRPRGRASSAEGYFTTIPSNESHRDEFYQSKSEDLIDSYSTIEIPSPSKRNYVVTALSKSHEKEREPTIRWLYAELDRVPGDYGEQQGNEVTRCDINGGVSNTKFFIHTGDDQVPCTSKSNGQAIFNRSSHSEPVDFARYETETPVSHEMSSSYNRFTPEERISNSYSSGRDKQLINSLSDVHDVDRRCSTPPVMTSTPYTTLERKDRNQVEMLSDGRELRQSHSVPSILSAHVNAAMDGSTISAQKKNSLDANEILSVPRRKRPTPVPIQVVNQVHQGRKGSLDAQESEKKTRKPIVTDIDWYAAFNMKEPSTPKSPSSFSGVDVMKGAEDVGEHVQRSRHDAPRSSEDKPLKASQIDLDEVFVCSNTAKNSGKECSCKACLLTKLSDEERAKFTLRTPDRPRVPSYSEDPQPRSRSENITQPVDISLDDVFRTDSSTDGAQTSKNGTSSQSLGPERVSRSEEPTSRVGEFATIDKVKISTKEPSSSLPYVKSEINLDDVMPLQGDSEQISARSSGISKEKPSSSEHNSEEKLGRSREPDLSDSSRLQRKNELGDNPDSGNWVEELVRDDSLNRIAPSPPKTSKSSNSIASAPYAKEARPVEINSVNKQEPNPPERVNSTETSSTEMGSQALNKQLGEAHTGDSAQEVSGEWLRSLVGEPEKPQESMTEKSPPANPAIVSYKGPEENSKAGATEEKTIHSKTVQENNRSEELEPEPAKVIETQKRPGSDGQKNASEIKIRPEILDEDPVKIHHPSGRRSLVGDVLRKPSVLEETPFNSEHLSPKDYVSKAYTQRLWQLKSELGLTEESAQQVADAEQAESSSKREAETASLDSVDQNRQGTEPVTGRSPPEDDTTISDEALIDAMFSEVLDGEASEGTSVGADSISRKIPTERQDGTDNSSPNDTKKAPDQSLGMDDWYDQPPKRDEEVKEYVSDLLSQSMSEAIFSASMSLKRKTSTCKKGVLITDTSFDKPLIQKLKTESIEETENQDSDEDGHENKENKGRIAQNDRENASEDPILKAVFTSSIDNQRYMESVISYPPSTVSPLYNSSTLTTPGTAKTKDGTNVFFATHLSPASTTNDAADGTYVSSASVMMNDTHSSSEGDFDNDHIIKLVFSDLPGDVKRTSAKKVEVLEQRPQEVIESMEESCQTPNSSVDSECFDADVTSRSTPRMNHEKFDDEMLEIEVFSDHFHIKGNYSLIINKDDPLGALLDELHSKGTSSLDFSIRPKLGRLLSQCLQEKSQNMPGGSELISSRAKRLLTDEDPSYEVDKMMSGNRFNASTNPQGNINFCTAENNICVDEVMAQLQKKGFSPDEAHLVHYPPAGGHSSTKETIRRYMAEFMSATVSEDELVILPSSTSAYDMLCHCTCEACDIVLTSTPTYAASVRNCGSRADCEIRPVEMDMDTPRLDVSSYQKALDTHHAMGGNVRAVLIINPHNPLGIVFPPDEVIRLCDWATRNDLVVLVDESFATCVFGSTNFSSFLTYRHRLKKPENVFYLWSLSKDFGIPGMKISVVQSSSPKLLQSLRRLELIHPVSALAHDAASALLSDFEWLRSFHSAKLAKLSVHYEFLANNLREIGLKFTPAVAGCFVMIDFRKHLRSQTFAAEISLWQKFCDRGVIMTPGQHVLCPQPGWMRLVFSCSIDELTEGVNRLRAFFNYPPTRTSITS